MLETQKLLECYQNAWSHQNPNRIFEFDIVNDEVKFLDFTISMGKINYELRKCLPAPFEYISLETWNKDFTEAAIELFQDLLKANHITSNIKDIKTIMPYITSQKSIKTFDLN